MTLARLKSQGLLAAVILLVTLSAQSSIALQASGEANPFDTRSYLERFHRTPKETMNAPLLKLDLSGRVVTDLTTPFAAATDEELFQAKNRLRERICALSGRDCATSAMSSRAAINEANQVEKFLFDPVYLDTLQAMEGNGLLQGQSPRAPWSDSFWPVQKGIIARRWMDANFPDVRTFIDNYNYYLANPPTSVAVNTMAPSEKYDYLVGDFAFRLTNSMWADGKATWDREGTVPGWAGICHGWAPASILTPAPKRSVVLPAPNGMMITFYPSDIKALASAAFAEAPPKTWFAGTRCKVSRPNEDEMGRVIDEGCFDVNPATWHIGIVNEMGVNKRGFILDSQYDYQIWNYPLYSYHYSYFNPQTLAVSSTLAGSIVKSSEFTIDKFKKYRSPNAKYVVGIAMEISYSTETAPSSRPYQTPKLLTEKILYDLELDANLKIIGGEWYSNFHPDFIWHFQPDAKPISVAEQDMPTLPQWDGLQPLSSELRRAAVTSSTQQQPLAIVIDTLVRLSQEADTHP